MNVDKKNTKSKNVRNIAVETVDNIVDKNNIHKKINVYYKNNS